MITSPQLNFVNVLVSGSGYDAIREQNLNIYDNFNTEYTRREFASLNSPGFPKVKIQNPYQSSTFKVLPGSFQIRKVVNWYYSYVFNLPELRSVGIRLIDQVPTDSSLYASCIAKHISEVKSSKFNLAVASAEGAKTVAMIFETATKLAKAIRLARKLDVAGVARVLQCRPFKGKVKDPANLWLQYKYGWMPLLSDVKGAAEHLARRNYGHPQTFRVTTRRSSEDSGYLYRNERYSCSAYGDLGLFDSSYVTKTSVLVTTIWEVTNPRLREASQLGLTNPLLVAWELVPFSFIADWFIPIGNYLESFDAFSGLTFKGGFVNTKRNCDLRHIGNGNAYDTQYSYAVAEGGCGESLRSQSRGIMQTPPTLALPKFELPKLSISKMITSLALLRQQANRL